MFSIKKDVIALAVGAILAAAAGGVVAQTIGVPKVPNVGPTDKFNDIVGGVPQARNIYALPNMIADVFGYVNLGTISGDPGYTFVNGVTSVYAHAASGITAVGLTTEPNPGDGKRECFWLNQTVTTLTWHANTGQTMVSRHAAGIADVPNCVTYVASSSTWYSSN